MARRQLTPVIPPTLALAEAAATPDPGVAGAIAYSSTTGRLMEWTGSAWRSLGRQAALVTLGSDVGPNTTTTLADVTGLSFSVKAGVSYRFEFFVVYQTAATTTGITLSVNGPASPTALAFWVDVPSNATTRVLGNRRTYDTGATGAGVDTINSNVLAIVRGVITPSADGTLIVRYASEVGSSGVTVKAGSTGYLDANTTNAGAYADQAPIQARDVSGTSDTFVFGDLGRAVRYTNSSDVTATVPPNSSVPFPVGTVIIGAQRGTGQVTFSPGSGVTLNAYGTPSPIRTVGRYARVALTKVATDEWDISGMFEPA
jgi:hypothetical protein